jgi:hypothetical protein
VSCLDTLSSIIVANNLKSDALILINFRKALPSSIQSFGSKLGPARFLSKVFIHHFCLRFFLHTSLLITTNAALQAIKSPSELDILVKNYS